MISDKYKTEINDLKSTIKVISQERDEDKSKYFSLL